jgi:hypothetical protein
MIYRCAWCETNSGRTHASRKCCELRRLATAPRHFLIEYAKTLTETEKPALRADIAEEKKRLRELDEN